jgi:hypothetical protein
MHKRGGGKSGWISIEKFKDSSMVLEEIAASVISGIFEVHPILPPVLGVHSTHISTSNQKRLYSRHIALPYGIYEWGVAIVLLEQVEKEMPYIVTSKE